MGKRKDITAVQAELSDVLVLKYENKNAVTVKGQCGHVWTTWAGNLRRGWRCGTCRHTSSPAAAPVKPHGLRKDIIAVQATIPDVLILKYEDANSATVKGQCGHVWTTTVGNLRSGQRCGSCALRGYNPDKPGWLYFMERPGEMQVGITNVPDRRLDHHTRNGWQLIDIDGPHDGATIFSREKAIRTYLRDADLLIDGTLENWPTTSWEPSSLAVIERIAA